MTSTTMYNKSTIRSRVSKTRYSKSQTTWAIRSVRFPITYPIDHGGLYSLTGNQLRKDLRNWLSPPDPSVNYNLASDAHHEGTAVWFIESNAFKTWKTSSSLLWIYGKRMFSSPCSFALANGPSSK